MTWIPRDTVDHPLFWSDLCSSLGSLAVKSSWIDINLGIQPLSNMRCFIQWWAYYITIPALPCLPSVTWFRYATLWDGHVTKFTITVHEWRSESIRACRDWDHKISYRVCFLVSPSSPPRKTVWPLVMYSSGIYRLLETDLHIRGNVLFPVACMKLSFWLGNCSAFVPCSQFFIYSTHLEIGQVCRVWGVWIQMCFCIRNRRNIYIKYVVTIRSGNIFNSHIRLQQYGSSSGKAQAHQCWYEVCPKIVRISKLHFQKEASVLLYLWMRV